MPSIAWQNWSADRAAALDEIEHAHRAVGGTGPGRRYLAQQLNQAYAVLLSSQFQGFCRDLYSECADHLAGAIVLPALRAVFRKNMEVSRRLNTGNPSPDNLGTDFDRLGQSLWPTVEGEHPRNPQRKALFSALNRWRNAIAHNDFAPPMCRAGRPALHLAEVQDWRKACDGLARSLDSVRRAPLLAVTGAAPW